MTGDRGQTHITLQCNFISRSQPVIMQQQQMNTNVAFQPSQSQHQPGYVVVNETPSGLAERLAFPINFRENAVLRISIAKIVIGFIQFVVGIADIFFLPFFTSIIAFPIWCGLLVSLFLMFMNAAVIKSMQAAKTRPQHFSCPHSVNIGQIAAGAKVEELSSKHFFTTGPVLVFEHLCW